MPGIARLLSRSLVSLHSRFSRSHSHAAYFQLTTRVYPEAPAYSSQRPQGCLLSKEVCHKGLKQSKKKRR